MEKRDGVIDGAKLCPHNVMLRSMLGGTPMSRQDVHFKLLVGAGTTRSFKAGETIFKEGDPPDEFFVVESGSVGLKLGDRLLETVDAHGIFGEMALVDNAPRSASAVALTDVTLAGIREKQFLFLVEETPFFAIKIMRVLARGLRGSNHPT
jgi:CRP/FNR family cyclic AMP-dependent transcriptional regulator